MAGGVRLYPIWLFVMFVLIALWVGCCAFLLYAVYESGQHPFDCSALCADNWTFVTLFAALVAIPTPILAVMIIGSGWWYMWQRTSARSWRAAWLVLAAVGAGLQGLFMWAAYNDCGHSAGCNMPHQGDARPLELLAGFALAGVAMIAVLMLAPNRPARVLPAR